MTDFNPDEAGAELLRGLSNAQQMMAQARAQMIEEANPRFEYARVQWEQVNDLAREGWILLLGLRDHEGWYVMQRKLSAAAEAEALLSNVQQAAMQGQAILGKP